jgi:hypothetical protein
VPVPDAFYEDRGIKPMRAVAGHSPTPEGGA